MSDSLRRELAGWSTPELLDILRVRDVDEWQPAVFPLAEEILRERGVGIPAPDSDDREDASPPAWEQLVRVAQFSTAIEASLCRMGLANAGIDARLSTEYLAGVAPHLGLALGVDVLVLPEDEAAAREVLAALDSGAAALPVDSEPCPRCGGSEVDHLKESDRMSAVSGLLLASLPLPRVTWAWRCRACGHEWE